MKENKQIQNLIAHISHFMKCPNCGANYDVENVQYLGKIQVFYVVQLFCERCAIPVFASVLVKESKVSKDNHSLKLNNAKDQKPISTDDIIDFHGLLANHDGDMKTLLG